MSRKRQWYSGNDISAQNVGKAYSDYLNLDGFDDSIRRWCTELADFKTSVPGIPFYCDMVLNCCGASNSQVTYRRKFPFFFFCMQTKNR